MHVRWALSVYNNEINNVIVSVKLMIKTCTAKKAQNTCIIYYTYIHINKI